MEKERGREEIEKVNLEKYEVGKKYKKPEQLFVRLKSLEGSERKTESEKEKAGSVPNEIV